ncbi:hypothetical protein [Bremerella sp.]|uniref:hypothetical protein n=1 Tax=Bremerella sp. TaxID=2795602 RepID=UPI00391C9278
MSHHSQPQAGSLPLTRQQQEAALFQRLIDLCDKQDDIIRRQQQIIDQLRQQLASPPEQTHTQQVPPPEPEQHLSANSPRPPRIELAPTQPTTTKQKPRVAADQDEPHTVAPSAKPSEPIPKPSLADALPQPPRMPSGPIRPSEKQLSEKRVTQPKDALHKPSPPIGRARFGQALLGYMLLDHFQQAASDERHAPRSEPHRDPRPGGRDTTAPPTGHDSGIRPRIDRLARGSLAQGTTPGSDGTRHRQTAPGESLRRSGGDIPCRASAMGLARAPAAPPGRSNPRGQDWAIEPCMRN